MTKILLVEDDTVLSDMYKMKLEKTGYGIATAFNGEEGLEQLAKDVPDLVLLDIVMPKMDGFQMLEAMKKEEKYKDIPVLMLTNLGQKQDIDKGEELGADGYLIKAHFTPSEVTKKIEDLLREEGKI